MGVTHAVVWLIRHAQTSMESPCCAPERWEPGLRRRAQAIERELTTANWPACARWTGL